MTFLSKNKPTESELAILQILWQNGPASVREVHDQLSENKEVGYTTTLKIMQLMIEKGIAKRDTSSRSHIYEASIEQKDTQNHLLSNFVNKTFQGSAAKLVLSALGNSNTSKEELKEIKSFISKLEKAQK